MSEFDENMYRPPTTDTHKPLMKIFISGTEKNISSAYFQLEQKQGYDVELAKELIKQINQLFFDHHQLDLHVPASELSVAPYHFEFQEMSLIALTSALTDQVRIKILFKFMCGSEFIQGDISYESIGTLSRMKKFLQGLGRIRKVYRTTVVAYELDWTEAAEDDMEEVDPGKPKCASDF